MEAHNITIRPIIEEDHNSILKLIDQCRPYVLPHHEYLYWILEHYYQSTCLVAEANQKAVGFVSGLPSKDQKSIFIWQICVDPDYRKYKIGYSLLEEVYKKLLKLEYTSMQFSIDKENIASYKLFERFAIENNMTIEAVDNKTICSSNEIAYKIFNSNTQK